VRRPRWIHPVSSGLFLLLAGCVQPAALGGSGDGDYRGSATRYQALRRTCPRPSQLLSILVCVRGGVMYYRWENQYIPVSVRTDGTLSGAAPGVQLTGTHDGTTMQGDVTDGQCGLHFTLKRVGS
jgi:hypothetical protein